MLGLGLRRAEGTWRPEDTFSLPVVTVPTRRGIERRSPNHLSARSELAFNRGRADFSVLLVEERSHPSGMWRGHACPRHAGGATTPLERKDAHRSDDAALARGTSDKQDCELAHFSRVMPPPH
jgi:hypothetical protein